MIREDPHHHSHSLSLSVSLDTHILRSWIQVQVIIILSYPGQAHTSFETLPDTEETSMRVLQPAVGSSSLGQVSDIIKCGPIALFPQEHQSAIARTSSGDDHAI